MQRVQYHLIKYLIKIIIQVQKFTTLFSNNKFRNLKTLTIYFSSWSLVYDQYQDMLCRSLMKLPKLKLFTIIVNDIKSDASFKQLGNKFRAIIDQKWYENEIW